MQVGISASVSYGAVSGAVSTEITASTQTEEVYTLGTSRSTNKTSTTRQTQEVPIKVAPYTALMATATIYEDVADMQIYRGTIAPYWRHVDDYRPWTLTSAEIVPQVIEIEIVASQASRAVVDLNEVALDGLFANATTIEQILAATDYTAVDSDTLRLNRAFLNREAVIDGETVPVVDGRVVVFDHRLLHEGKSVERGQKLVLRNDVVAKPIGVSRPSSR